MSGEGDVHRAAPAARRKRGFPAPATILPAVLVWIAAFLIPSGEYQRDAASGPVANSFRYVPSPVDFGGRVRELLLAPVNGMYGIQDAATGMISPFLFILSIGAFMTVVFATGALDLGITLWLIDSGGARRCSSRSSRSCSASSHRSRAGATRAWVSMASWFH